MRVPVLIPGVPCGGRFRMPAWHNDSHGHRSHGGTAADRTRTGPGPPFREIIVIETRKVFDFCFQEDTLERCSAEPNLGAGAQVLSCQITNVSCQEITPRELVQDQPGLSLVSIQVNLTLSITIQPATGAVPGTVQRVVAFPKRLVLCAPVGTDVTCDVRGTCVCTLQPLPALCTITQATADVKVLVPTFGTVIPQPCNVSPAFGGCPPMPPTVCGPGALTTTGTEWMRVQIARAPASPGSWRPGVESAQKMWSLTRRRSVAYTEITDERRGAPGGPAFSTTEICAH